MRQVVKKYLPFSKASAQEYIEYRFDIIMLVAGMMLSILVLWYLWYAIFSSSGNSEIDGFSIIDMTTYIILTNILLFCMDTDTVWYVSDEVRTGAIAINLIKPVSYHLRIYFKQLGSGFIKLIAILCPALLGLMLYKYLISGMIVSISNIVLFIISITIGYTILFLFDFIFAMMAFYTKNIWGIGFAKAVIVRLLNGALIPLAFFPKWSQSIFSYLPFKSMVYTPVLIFLNKYSESTNLGLLGMQFIWVCILMLLNGLIWRIAINRLTVQGG